MPRWVTFKRCLAGALALLTAVGPSAAHAYTQCTVSISNIWSGDAGYVWLNFTNGGSVLIPPSNASQQAVLSLAMTSYVLSRPMVVRYSTNGVDCASAGRSDFVGIYLASPAP